MATKRTYGDACGVARALDTVGERWALMVVRELILGPKRFTDIREALPHLSPDVLAQRLRELEQTDIVRRRTLPPPAASKVYELTSRGAALEPVLIALGRWGGANADPPAEGLGMSLDSHVMSLRTLFDPELAGVFAASFALRLDDQTFRVEVGDGQLEVVRGELSAPDATVVTDPTTFLDLIRGRRELGEALDARDVEVEGDAEAVDRFLGFFPLPAAA